MDLDCIVIGGGVAGQSAALALGRARRRTLLADEGRPSNLAAHGVGGLIGHDGRPPADLYERGRAEIAAYPAVEHRATTAVDAVPDGDGFAVTLDDGTRASAATVLLATGMEYRYPEVPGAAERWGGSVFHCPFCHGWEVRERPLAVLDPGQTGVHRALLLRAWSDEVTLLTNGAPPVDADRLLAAGVRIEERPVAALRGPGTELETVVLEDGDELPCQGVLVATTMHQRTDLAARLGAQLKPPGPLFADAVDARPDGATSVPGLFVAGDAAGIMPSVPNALASGAMVGAALVRDLMGAA